MGCPILKYYEKSSSLKVAYSSNLEIQKPAREVFIFNRKNSAGAYRYGFNGMESDDEIKGQSNSYDFGARMYDNRLGRWMSVDPYESKYPSLSPYNYVRNAPILFIDPNGKEIRIYGDAEEFARLIRHLFNGNVSIEMIETINRHKEEAANPHIFPPGYRSYPGTSQNRWYGNKAYRTNLWTESYSTITINISDEDIKYLSKEQLAIYNELQEQIQSKESTDYLSYKEDGYFRVSNHLPVNEMNDILLPDHSMKPYFYYFNDLRVSGKDFKMFVNPEKIISNPKSGLNDSQIFLFGLIGEDSKRFKDITDIQVESWNMESKFVYKNLITGERKKGNHMLGKFKTKSKGKTIGKSKNPRFL